MKWLLAIPHLIIAYLLTRSRNWWVHRLFSILFTKTYPEGLFRFALGAYRWQHNVYSVLGPVAR